MFKLGSMLVVFPLAILSAAAARAEQTLTYADLVNRMTDLRGWPCLPAAGEKCAQCSSYDRASKYDEKTGKYINWDANGDGSGFIRKRGRANRDGRDEGPRLHLANLVGRGEERPRVDLSGRAGNAGRRSALRELFQRRYGPVQLPDALVQLGHAGLPGARTSTCRSRSRSRARSWPTKIGALLPFHLQHFPEGHEGADVQRGLGGGTENAAALQKVNDFFRDNLGEDPAGDREGQETRAQRT